MYFSFLSQDRMWRKTRSPGGSGCYGADANRNFDFHWLGKHLNTKIYKAQSAT